MYADGADQPFHSLPDLIGDKYVGQLLFLMTLDYICSHYNVGL